MNRYEVSVRIQVEAEDVLEAEDKVRNQLNHVDIRRKGIGHWFWDGTMVRIGTSPFVQPRSLTPRGWANTEDSAALPLTPEQVFTTAVLPTPPGWMTVGYPLKEVLDHYSQWIVRLGNSEGFRACLAKHKQTHRVQFHWGCREIDSEALAHDHWRIDPRLDSPTIRRSIDGGRVSYRAAELIAYAAACSQALGWDWHSAPASAAPPNVESAASSGAAPKEKTPLPPMPKWMWITPRIGMDDGDDTVVVLGMIDGFDASVAYDHNDGVHLFWGCREIISEAEARVHWVDTPTGIESTLSHEPRPHAIMLIDYVVALCQHRGWSW
jgi:hypothetical protein